MPGRAGRCLHAPAPAAERPAAPDPLWGRPALPGRPAWVSRRGRPWWAPGAGLGDWEGDTLGRRSPIVTHVERKSRSLLAGKLADRTAATFAVGSVTLFQPLPVALRRTLTLDNGSECARFSVIAAHTGLAVYFAAPYAAWQRGTNETTNGLLRQSFPKGTDFRRVTSPRTASGPWTRLNHRPRKCLGSQTPHEVFTTAAREVHLQSEFASMMSRILLAPGRVAPGGACGALLGGSGRAPTPVSRAVDTCVGRHLF